MSTFIDRYNAKQSGLKPKTETKADVLKKWTHLYLNGKHIEEIVRAKNESFQLNKFRLFSAHQGDLSPCENLKVLYLHNNNIKEIANCQSLHNLTHLYLQWNRIRKIQNIDELTNLRKLYLGHNEIVHLENMDKLDKLEELHIERQISPNEGEPLQFTFDLASLRGMAGSLRILNVCGLNLNHLEDLRPLKQLQQLIASENKFSNAENLANFVRGMPNLTDVNLKGCPAQKCDRHYRDKIILGSDALSK